MTWILILTTSFSGLTLTSFGKVVNIASRCAGFIYKQFDGQLSAPTSDNPILAEFSAASETISPCTSRTATTGKRFGISWRLRTRRTNILTNTSPGSSLRREDKRAPRSAGLLRRVEFLSPAGDLPETGAASPRRKIRSISWNSAARTWGDLDTRLTGHTINKFTPLMTRIEPEKVAAIVNASMGSSGTRTNVRSHGT